jgi:hypothetical protein
MGMTGIEEEWREALKANAAGSGRPHVSAYFNQAQPPTYELDPLQVGRLTAFRQQIYDERVALVCKFAGPDDFADKFRGHLLERLLEQRRNATQITESTEARLNREVADASRALLVYPSTVGCGIHIERPESRAILQQISDLETSVTMVLGGPGSGKSVMISTVTKELTERQIPVLAIKADLLGRAVNSPEDLRKSLELTLSPSDALRIVAKSQKVVLLIDQLDAVSDILDRHSGRLNVLLDLIHRLSGWPNIHIVTTCRPFEFQHDVRLASVIAKRMTLALPTWEEVAPVLEASGHSPAAMGAPLRELLRTPWHLKIYLDLAMPGANFDTLHALLEALWKKTVLETANSADRVHLLEKLATQMSADEALWVPSALADELPEAREALERVEVLQRSATGNQIGFRHQSYYEFTLARSFARGTNSLAQYVLARQDGLFVRPVLLNGLSYLRSVSPTEYRQALTSLLASGPRLHIRSLLIEYVGQQSDPCEAERGLAQGLLRSEEDGPRILSALSGATTWLHFLQYQPEFEAWMRKTPESAAHCLPFLTRAASACPQEVFALVANHWSDPHYDALVLTVLNQFTAWNPPFVALVVSIAERLESWFIPLIAERVLDSCPALAPRILRADLNRRLRSAEEKREIPAQTEEAPSDQTEDVMAIGRRHRLGELLAEDNSHSWDAMESLAEGAPREFLAEIWPWLLDVIGRIAESEHDILVGYRDDPVTYSSFEGELAAPLLVRATLAAAVKLAEADPSAFLEFVAHNAGSDLTIVHRILSRAMQRIVAHAPHAILEYLIGDPRRLLVGDFDLRFRESKGLIAALFPYLTASDRVNLEQAIIRIERYKAGIVESDPKVRFDRQKWARQDRLRLLRAIPREHMTLSTLRLTEEEERALPGLSEDEDRIRGGCVGPRMTAAELRRAKDDDVLQLLDELPDATGWDNPRRSWTDDFSRAGGAIQQSREIGELAKSAPERVVKLLPKLQPGRHESYAGAAVEGLVNGAYPGEATLTVLSHLVERGFGTSDFQSHVGSALEALAGKIEGLPDWVLVQLRNWLAKNPEPIWPPDKDVEREEREDISGSILFGHGGTFSLPHGRGALIRAIAAGCLERKPPAYEMWAEVIESRIQMERHPAVWVVVFMNMPVLLNWERTKTTKLYDSVIKACPLVLRYNFVIHAIGRGIQWFQPAEVVRTWLELLLNENCPFCDLAHGELLMLYRACYADTWSADRIREHLKNADRVGVLRGLAYGASELWNHDTCQPLATEILSVLAGHPDDSVQMAVARLFFRNQDALQLTLPMREVIAAVCQHPNMLRKCTRDLVEALAPCAASAPELVANVFDAAVEAASQQISRTELFTLAETFTNVALTLHRLEAFRERGLRLFERLLVLNVREARAALDLLDRKPGAPEERAFRPIRPRRRRRRAG